ncbi:hypothetical protein DFJ58DRAFT_778581 [Suillus subalutaceus]|uniref:uncharacterized protein n=1 Tax=Suillus subalutaceus TaxID=48586 RepID=UPI001B878348|nr:uncharacterized protein DFJ58DRAFT_778581 [Suillus subalutaceus]KAG1860706.1 hypothetical protein DFJ58DRAFT_778581 [Suillus subalutaceus]
MRIFVLSCAIALLLSVCSAGAALTNAQRLARGLPILPPKFGRSLPGYARSPTVAGVKDPSPSSAPPQTITGRILVKSHNGKSLGHLHNMASGINGVNFGASSADLHVSFTTSRSGKGLIDIQAVDAAFHGPHYIGTTSSHTLATGSSTAVDFGNAIRTPVHSPPVPAGQHNADESAIWTFDPRTHELKVQYVNPDGQTAKTIIAYNIHDNTIFFVGDIGAYNAAQVHPDHHVSPITFYLDSAVKK